MASFFFEDYYFPSELYNRETGDFTTPIRTLLDFAPFILEELPKKEKDKKPIKSDAEDSWTKTYLLPSSHYLTSVLKSDKARAVTEFVIRCGNEYLKSKEEDQRGFREFKEAAAASDYYRRKEKNKKKYRHKWFFNSSRQEDSSSEEEEEERREEELRKEEKRKQKEQEKQQQQQQVLAPSTTASTLVKSAAAAGLLSLSLYSTYQTSVKFNEISFHKQLEILITQVQSIIQSTEVWIEEHDKMNDKVPNQVRTDIILLKQLVDYLIRLDPRANKKMEAAGWGCGAIGGLSALGGIALGSTAALTGGAALALGGTIVMISSKASGKSQLGARLLLENQVREKVATCQKNRIEREKVIEHEFIIKADEANIGEKRKNKEEGKKVNDKKKVKHELQPQNSIKEEENVIYNDIPNLRKERSKIALNS
ncbi:uncharacterized protein BX663DRAFT_560442 [Cokeromyces recurvatus]|uniref:uncharacterized protein n=1 Tax=Cokeromyces recurvatus TaxID=90255 RepID=UPI002220BC35|nr:uncharacterized protein BX663DRAFT_560442 [Cokeromyces recurvatus]KAI7903440.1 hypothetical protein BX663DRAFT_560442 [Cokeromyces recurvatus]